MAESTGLSWNRFKEVIEVLQSAATIIALIVGGIWTYQIFVKERKDYPHANTVHKVSTVKLSQDATLLDVAVSVSNTGTKLLTVENGDIRVQQVLPIAECAGTGPCAKRQIQEALQTTELTSDVFTWPLLARREKTWEEGEFQIEPGETDQVYFQFVIPSNVQFVRIYSYLKNATVDGKGEELGWAHATIHQIEARK